MQKDIISYKGANFTRYPDGKSRSERVYYSGRVKFNGVSTKMRLHVYKYMCELGEIPKGFHVHHIDENPLNNELSNFELLPGGNHISEHVKKRFIENPEWAKVFHEKGIEAATEWHKSDEGRKWHSKQAEKNYKKRVGITKICVQCGNEYTTKHAGESKYCHQNCNATALRRRRGIRPVSERSA